MDIEIDGRYLRHANPTSERISDNARRRARNNRRVIQIEDALPPARLLMRFTYEGAMEKWRPAPLSLSPPLFSSLLPSAGTQPSEAETFCRNRGYAASVRVRSQPRALRKREGKRAQRKFIERYLPRKF